jgi:hypothetical protein
VKSRSGLAFLRLNRTGRCGEAAGLHRNPRDSVNCGAPPATGTRGSRELPGAAGHRNPRDAENPRDGWNIEGIEARGRGRWSLRETTGPRDAGNCEAPPASGMENEGMEAREGGKAGEMSAEGNDRLPRRSSHAGQNEG